MENVIVARLNFWLRAGVKLKSQVRLFFIGNHMENVIFDSNPQIQAGAKSKNQVWLTQLKAVQIR
ncbi:MAG: hypothetical protein GY795_05660 [Desulfobacterales bacterium]|nr:hypothetical protein [Desulfobacterales bacterium]